MLKKLLFTSLMLFTLNALGQKLKIDAVLVLQNNDTLRGKLQVKTWIIDNLEIIETSFNVRMVFFPEGKEKIVLNHKRVKSLRFTDTNGRERYFIAKNFVRLLEVIHEEKIKWYKNYTWDSYNQTQYEYDLIFDELGVKYNIGLFNSKKNKLREITKDNQEIAKLIEENKMTDENMLMVIKAYERILAEKQNP